MDRQSAAGHEFTVFDENRKKCADAALWLSGHEYKADSDGVVTVPFSTKPGDQTIILAGNNQDVDLWDSKAFNVNQVDLTQAVHDIFLYRPDKNYVLDVLGKNGEPNPEAAISLTFKHRYFRDPIDITLKTNKNGRLQLSSLEGIDWMEARLPDNVSRRWPLNSGRVQISGVIHAQVDTRIHIPFVGSVQG